MVAPGDDLAGLLLERIAAQDITLEAGDVLVVAQKIVSKAEGRQVRLADVTPSREAEVLAEETDKDPRLVQLILDESTEVLRKKTGILIVRHVRSGSSPPTPASTSPTSTTATTKAPSCCRRIRTRPPPASTRN